MIPPEQIAEARRLYYAEHWKIGTIAAQLGLHPDTVRPAVTAGAVSQPKTPRPRVTDPYVPFIRETLERYPTLRATRIFEMIRHRGYGRSAVRGRRRAASGAAGPGGRSPRGMGPPGPKSAWAGPAGA